jgi:hypothetical protein
MSQSSSPGLVGSELEFDADVANLVLVDPYETK